jgi:hypothetical protein
VEAKVILLNEMLDNVDKDRGEQFVAGDVYEVRTWSPLGPCPMNNPLSLLTASILLDISRYAEDSRMDIRRRGPRSRFTRCVEF